MTDKQYPDLPQIDDATDEVIDLVSHECALSTAGGATVQTEWDEDDLYTVERAADLLEGYVEFIKREVTSVDIEAHPYLPEVEGVAKDLRTLAARPSPVAVVAEPPPLIHEQIDRAAKVLAELFDYPWEHMPEEGKARMRAHVVKVFEAALPPAPKE